MIPFVTFLSGGIVMANAAVGLILYRFWRNSRDRLFLMFSLAFWVFAIERFLLVLVTPNKEITPLIYVVRLLGFFLIVWGILEKNRGR